MRCKSYQEPSRRPKLGKSEAGTELSGAMLWVTCLFLFVSVWIVIFEVYKKIYGNKLIRVR